MDDLVRMLTVQLNPIFGIIFIGTGLYSLIFNVKDARRKNHPRAEKVARLGGWLYLLGGIATLIIRTKSY